MVSSKPTWANGRIAGGVERIVLLLLLLSNKRIVVSSKPTWANGRIAGGVERVVLVVGAVPRFVTYSKYRSDLRTGRGTLE